MWHRDINAQKLGNGAHQALCLPQLLLENHAKCQTHLNRQIKIDRLATRCRARWSRPHRKRVIADLNRQISTLPQAFVVLCAVGHVLLLLWDLVATISVKFVRHLKHRQENRPHPISAVLGSLQQRHGRGRDFSIPTTRSTQSSDPAATEFLPSHTAIPDQMLSSCGPTTRSK